MKNGNGRTKRLIAGGLVGLLGLTFAPSAADAAISTTNFCANVPTGQSGFTDIAQAGVHQRNVECAKAAGIIQGTTATTYNPTGELSRGQMASIIANFIDMADRQDAPGGATVPSLPTAAASQDRFTDDETSVHENNINRLAQAGVVQGTSATTFDPSGLVSRAQMASFVAQALAFVRGAALPEGADAFTDDETSVHEANINRLANADIVDGTGARGSKAVFSPSANVSRAGTASFGTQAGAFIFQEGLITAVPAPATQGTTSRPELTTARVVGTVTEGVNAGTTIEYTMDELGASSNAQAPLFHAIGPDGTRFDGDVVTQPNTGNPGADRIVALVRFTDAALSTNAGAAALASSLTLATVDQGAFIDLVGEPNPEGDAPLNTVGSQPLPAGVSNAPDLASFGNFRAANATNTFVDFVWDEAADSINGAGTYHLVYTIQGPAAAISITCNFDSGTATTTHTVICPNAADDGDATTPLQAAVTARAYVDPGAVDETAAANAANVLTAADGPNATTGSPDLVSGSFNLAATNGGNPADAAILVWDEAVTFADGSNNPAEFSAYLIGGNGTQVSPTAVGYDANTPTQVALFFPDGALTNAVGVSVLANAVENATGSNIGVNNQPDEVGIGNNTASTGAGTTSTADLVSVQRTGALDLFGNATGGFVLSYNFDEDAATPVANRFRLYLPNGLLLVAQSCAVGTTEATDNIVTCIGDANSSQGPSYLVVGTGNEATNAQVQQAVLATVDNAAVTDQAGGAASAAEIATGIG